MLLWDENKLTIRILCSDMKEKMALKGNKMNISERGSAAYLKSFLKDKLMIFCYEGRLTVKMSKIRHK